ncbi:MAG: glycosyltransferase family 4 protein, partial [Actinomycetota bacterium]|nr:glycosyltransferase family 4 protein [Actinomycetota bacterium]
VQTLHDYHHVCPADNLLRGGERVCEPPACSKLNYVPAITNRCAHGSRSVSTLSAAETWFQRARKAYEHGISRFISPSVFLAQVMARGGWTSVPCDVVPNAVPLPESTPRSSGAGCHAPSRFVFAGRLSADKGVDVLLRAAAESGTRVLIAGDGAQRAELEQLASTLGGKARSGYSAEFLGRVSGERIDELLCGAHAAVVPSVWYENAPMSVLEPMALGVPVIASRIGGIPEMVDDGVEGFLVEPGDAGALAEAMRAVAADSARAFAIGEAGRRRIAGSFSAERHMSLLLESYRAAGAPA